MKQLFIVGNKPYASSSIKPSTIDTAEAGTIGLFSLADDSLITNKPTSNFSIAISRGAGKMPLTFPEVDIKTLQVTLMQPEDGATFTAKITVPTPTKGEDYTVVVVKKGTVFNERSNWTFTTVATDTTAATVAKRITEQINANTYQLGVHATYSGGAITITANEMGTDFEVLGADGLLGIAPTNVTQGKKKVGDKAYIEDLASRCAAGKGFNYLADEGKDIYPGYPEVVEDQAYALFTLRFAVPRVASKQRDEVVYQLVHLAVPNSSDAFGQLGSIFGFVDNLPQ